SRVTRFSTRSPCRPSPPLFPYTPLFRSLAEHLADLRRGNEIPLGAERVPRGVITGVRFAHELRQADRAGRRDQPPEAVGQAPLRAGRRIAHQAAALRRPLASSGRRRAQITSASPARISGTLSHCPRDRPVSITTWARWASGSRKNSTTKRAAQTSAVNAPTSSPGR